MRDLEEFQREMMGGRGKGKMDCSGDMLATGKRPAISWCLPGEWMDTKAAEK